MDLTDYQWARPYMHDDERILWRGHPEKLHILEKSELPLTVFASVWTGFFLIREIIPMISSFHFDFSFSEIIPLLFFLVGLYLLIGRLIQKAVCLRASSYVVTNYRVLIRIRDKVHVFNKIDLPPMTVVRYSDGEGTIVFDPDYQNHKGRSHTLYVDQRNVIHSIADVDNAIRAIHSNGSNDD